LSKNLNLRFRIPKFKTRNSVSAIFDEASKLQPSKRGRHKMSSPTIWLPRLSAQVSNYVNRQSSIANGQCIGGGEGIRTPDPRVANAVLCQLSYAPESHFRFLIVDFRSNTSKTKHQIKNRKSKIKNTRGWLRGRDLNPRPLGYEPNELPDCSTPRQIYSFPRTANDRKIKTSNRQSEI
jgi:hypothetical protein